jgi:D-inositol-3-phosphate glycosyltransferase
VAQGTGAGEASGAIRLRVGTFVHARSPWAEGHGESVFGAQVAALAFEQALSWHAHADIEAVFLDPAPERPPAPAGPGRVRYHGLDEFLRGLPSRRVDAWFDVTGDVVRPFYLRAQLAQHEYPVTVTHHAMSYQQQAVNWFLPLLLARARPYDSVICTSQAAREVIRERLEQISAGLEHDTGARLGYAGRYDVIPFGVDTEVFRPRDKTDARRQIGLLADSTLILWLGRFGIGDKADLLPLIRVFAQLQESASDPRLRLVLAGSGPGRDVELFDRYARALGVRDRIDVLTDTSPAIRHLLHAAADIFVSPVDNIQETMGITPLEAMACGVPQVASDWDGYRELVRHGHTGFLAGTIWYPSADDLARRGPLDSGAGSPYPFLDHIKLAQSVSVDPAALHEALRRLVAEPDLRRRFGEASRQRAVQHYSWEAVISRYEALWRELDEIRRAGPGTPAVPGLAWLSASYDRIFGHYPSELLHDSSTITATADAAETLAGERLLPLYEDRAGVTVENLSSILSVLADQDHGITLREIMRREQQRGVPGPVAARHLLWLMKQGLARRGPA